MQIYFDIGVASSAFKPANDRMLGDKNVLPTDAEPAGRIVIGEKQEAAQMNSSSCSFMSSVLEQQWCMVCNDCKGSATFAVLSPAACCTEQSSWWCSRC
jgi:hypothetical protein